MIELGKAFRQFCPLSPVEIKAMKAADYVLDANVLLHIYRLSMPTRQKLLESLRQVQERIWIPHQIAYEFHRNRAGVIAKQLAKADQTRNALESEIARLDEAITKILTNRYHPYVDKATLLKKVQDTIRELHGDIQKATEEYFVGFSEDPLLSEVHSILNGRVGDPFPGDKMLALFKEADERYKSKIPPGYMDASKGVPEKYGDFIFWKEMLAHYESVKRPVILVTDDSKEDWIWTASGRTISIRPELRAEFYAVTDQPIVLFSLQRFIEQIGEEQGAAPEASVLEEISESANQLNARLRLEDALAKTVVAQSGGSQASLPASVGAAEFVDTLERDVDALRRSERLLAALQPSAGGNYLGLTPDQRIPEIALKQFEAMQKAMQIPEGALKQFEAMQKAMQIPESALKQFEAMQKAMQIPESALKQFEAMQKAMQIPESALKQFEAMQKAMQIPESALKQFEAMQRAIQLPDSVLRNSEPIRKPPPVGGLSATKAVTESLPTGNTDSSQTAPEQPKDENANGGDSET